MSTYYYDFHLHSCLSPCGDNDMTPNNIAGMGTLAGLQMMALTDHNTARNCPAFFEAAKEQGIIPVAGMELTTAEDIHMCCLFEQLEDALSFDAAVNERRVPVKNRRDIFGDQLIMNGKDEVVGEEENLLPNATTLSLEDGARLAVQHHGVCWPAHIDRPANGIIATLGTFPDTPPFGIAEIRDPAKFDELQEQYPLLKSRLLVSGSDAHYLWDIRDKCCSFELEDEPYSGELVRHRLFEKLHEASKALEAWA